MWSVDDARRAANGRDVSLVYQRYSVHNYAGLQIARRLHVPFVLEYNGSEVWMGRHWGRRLKYEELADSIELLNVRAANLVVVVSRAMRDELIARGIERRPHPRQPQRRRHGPLHACARGCCVRRRYGLTGKTVVGFISTFQAWHGADVLAEAFARLIADHPACRDSVRLLMVGDGPGLPATRRIISAAGLDELAIFTGLVEQQHGPDHLAACDILASPHVPNADGSPFFGSPTKLFEYMAMGKAIVASDLDQIGDVLRHGETAWMVPPADVGALAEGMARLIDDPVLRAKLGGAARREVLARYTWRAHVRRTLDALGARLDANRMSRRLLAVSWDMPPLSGPRAVQVSRTLKHLVPLGWKSWVVAFGPRSNRYNQDHELAGAPERPHGRHTSESAFARGATAVPDTVARAAAAEASARREVGVDWSRDAGRRAARHRTAIRRAGVVCATVVGPSRWTAHPSGDRLAVDRTFQRSLDRQPVPERGALAAPAVGADGGGCRPRADAIVFVNAQTADRVMRKYSSEWRRKTHIVPHGFDPTEPSPTPAARDTRLTIVHTGRFYDGLADSGTLLTCPCVAVEAPAAGVPPARRVRRHADSLPSPAGSVADA